MLCQPHSLPITPRSATIASEVLGSDNLLQVKLEDLDDLTDEHGGFVKLKALTAMRDLLLEGLEVCGRRFVYFAHKVEHNMAESKLIFVAAGDSIHNRPSGAGSSGGDVGHWTVHGSQHRWRDAAAARALFADFLGLPVSKMVKRMQLLFSPSTRWLDGHHFHVVRGRNKVRSALP